MGYGHRLRRIILSGTALPALAIATAAAAQDDGSAFPPNIVNILDTITITPSRTAERAIEALAGVSVIEGQTLQTIQPQRLGDVFQSMPGVVINQNRDDAAVGFNVRGLQDFGRVVVLIDGARQNYQQSSHGPQGQVFADPALLSGADVVRGPVANIYGSGAIGGVVSMRTKDVADILSPDQRFGMELFGGLARLGATTTTGLPQVSPDAGGFIAARPTDRFEFVVGGNARSLEDYADGNGNIVENTANDTWSGLAKAAFMPAEGHRFQLGLVHVNSTFDSGQPGSPFNPFDGPVYGNVVNTSTGTASYTFASPDNPLIDFSATGYLVRTNQHLVVEEAYGICSPFPAFCFTGPVGTESDFTVTTRGADVHNTSRFAGAGFEHTVTYGGDVFQDQVVVSGDDYGPDSGFLLTPEGNRLVYGAFVQWLAERGTWLDLILAARYDGYRLEGNGATNSGSRLSPKATVAVTPFDGITVYGTYAEGYRAPAVSEALVAGFHPGMIFQFIPNPSLRPEIGRNLEGGVNLAFNDVLVGGDTLRVKGNYFRNRVTDFIDLGDLSADPSCTYVMGCFGYINIANALLQGFEIEGAYDAGAWYAELNYTHITGQDVDTGDPLASVAPDVVNATLAARLFERKLTLGTRLTHAMGADENPSTGAPADPYSLIGLFASFEPSEALVASLVVDNLLNVQYTRYLENLPSPGISVKGSVKVRFGG